MDKIKKIIDKLFWVPFLVGLIGYILEGISVLESIYASLALYFINPVVEKNSSLILFSKLTSMLVTTRYAIMIVSGLIERFERGLKKMSPDSIAIYTDNLLGEDLANSLNNAYIGKNRLEKAKNFILFYDDDIKNINMYLNYKEFFKDKKVYLKLDKFDSYLFSEQDEFSKNGDLILFNIKELIARKYWRKFDIFDPIVSNKKYKISIIGSSFEKTEIIDHLVKFGLINNIYGLEQKIDYNIWGYNSCNLNFLSSITEEKSDKKPFFLNECVKVHNCSVKESMDDICSSDRIILCIENPYELLQELVYLGTESEVHVFIKDGSIDFKSFFKNNQIKSFGNIKEILNEHFIYKDIFFRKAKLFNYDYTLRESKLDLQDNYIEDMEKQWSKLSGFKKGSNVSKSDHYWIMEKLKAQGSNSMYLEELEHLRWSRFHIVNRWNFSQIRDDKNRKHNLLIPYKNLSREEQEKDGFYSKKIEELIKKLEKNKEYDIKD